LGLLLNFNVLKLTDGLKRVINGRWQMLLTNNC
jgi:hypothetical protein